LGISKHQHVLLFFGIVRPYKGLQVLLDSLTLLKSESQTPFLIVAGEFWDGAQAYLDAIQRLGLNDAVRIENRYIPNEEVDLFFSAADVLVAPYLAGTQSAAVALALGRRLPVILTSRIAAGVPPSARELTRVVPAGDAAALASAIRALIAELPALRPPLIDPAEDWLRLVHLLEALGAASPNAEAAP
jgi:glycosyltransferase involved in cell wall biosynthesis